MSEADDALIIRAKAGEADAWRQLYEHVGGRLVVWLGAQPQLDSALDADDIAHDAWVTAAGKIADFTGDADDFTGWLFGIARNLTMNANRRTLRRANSSLDEHELAIERQHAGEPQTPAAVQQEWTRQLLAQLTRREAQVVACIDVVGLDISATSSSLGISPAAVRVAHHRALRRLRELVTAEDAGLSLPPVVGPTTPPPADAPATLPADAPATPPLSVGSWH